MINMAHARDGPEFFFDFNGISSVKINLMICTHFQRLLFYLRSIGGHLQKGSLFAHG